MNQNQKKQVQAQIDQYFQADIAKLVATSYPDVDKDKAVIGEYSSKEFLSISNKVFNQFKIELEGAYFKSLPFQYQFHNEYGSGDLKSDLTNYNACIKSSRFPSAIQHLNRLVHYQAVNGFWEKSKRKYFRSTEDAVNSEKERILLVSKQLELQTGTLNGLLEEIENVKSNLEQFTGSKKKELSEIESLLTASRNHNNEITEIHSSATSLFEKIKSLLNASESKKNDTDILHKESRAELKKLQRELENQTETITSQNSDYEVLEKSFKDKLSFVEGKFDFFNERNQYLDDLIGREVGASLFETFKQRKGELSSSITFWKLCVPITAAFTIGWIFFLFGNGDLANLAWQVIFVNSLKALPAIGLLLFSISQYTKERNFQEEYAFKSAVALTVNSYAGQLVVQENKDKLIMDSVNEIYKSPLSSKHKDAEAKSLSGTAKELTDVVKSLLKDK